MCYCCDYYPDPKEIEEPVIEYPVVIDISLIMKPWWAQYDEDV